jgi:hypothetical protein
LQDSRNSASISRNANKEPATVAKTATAGTPTAAGTSANTAGMSPTAETPAAAVTTAIEKTLFFKTDKEA